MDSGLSKKSWILALSADLSSFLPSMVEEESLLLLQTHPSAWALVLPLLGHFPCLLSQVLTLFAVLLSQTNGSLDLKRTKANLPLISYLLLGTSPSIVFTLQPKFMAFSIKPKLCSSNRQALTVLSSALSLAVPHCPVLLILLSSRATPFPSEPHLGYYFSQDAPESQIRLSGSHLCWQSSLKMDFAKPTKYYVLFFFVYVCAVHLLFVVGSCLKDSCRVCLGSGLFHALEVQQPLAGVV